MSVSRHHADWLSLVETSGPFLSLPVLLRAFPQGLDPRDPEQARQLRLTYEEWQQDPSLAGSHREWILYVLSQTLGYPRELLTESQSIPPGLVATMAEYGETLRPDIALLGPEGGELAGKVQALISAYPAEQSLEKPVSGKHWKATPATRMTELLHATDVPLGLVTNGEQWMLVFAPRGETTGYTSWYAALWIDEPITLRAFHSLLSARRFFGVAASDTLLSLLKESAQDQQEVTNQLGDQVHEAVEVLIQAFDRLDQDSGRTLLQGFDEKNLYDAALTVMMRLVFLFSAEERDLLHLGKPMYDENYAVSTLREQLQEVADRHGEEVLERRYDAWARLLATFRAVHGGVSHQDLMLPAYGGSLFDPDRYPFLEGRPQGSRWTDKPAEPLAINNRVVLHLLKSLQVLQVRMPGGGPAEARRVSFVALDIEQIGHIYEGLLDHTAVRAREAILGLVASRKKSVASIMLSELETLRQHSESRLIEKLEETTERSAKALEKALRNGESPEDFQQTLIACGQDQQLAQRVRPFMGLLRQDSFERPVIVLPGGMYVGEGAARRSTGTHYTPRSLTEPIVQQTLEPLVYTGPAEGLAKEQWRLKSPKDILDLKICDMTMGSGAFLVQVCRYLAERLVEAWENLEKEHPGEVLITPEGGFSSGERSERLIPKEADERLAIARRLVADRCMYGVDINPMAVEMAKLSIWLITVDKTRPFTFLDHALKCGDSLLGISRLSQLETFSLNDKRAKQTIILSNYDELIRIAISKRRELERLPSNDGVQIAAKIALLSEAEERLERLKLAADLLITAELAESKEQRKSAAVAAAHMKVTHYIGKSIEDFRRFANEQLQQRKAFHWPLEYPEVIERGGFDGLIGNPPFVGGKKITGLLGTDYRDYLVNSIAGGKLGVADICAFFFLRAASLLQPDHGTFGLLATNTIAQGDTREVGLEQVCASGGSITRAVKSAPWPGDAALEVSHVWWHRGPWRGMFILDEAPVTGITSFLNDSATSSGVPYRLAANAGISFQGSVVLGLGFVISAEEAEALLSKDVKNRDVIHPFLNGDDVNSRPDQTPSRWTINFFDWPLERIAKGQWASGSEDDRASWVRSGRVPADYPYPVAGDYGDCLQLIRERVKPERDKVKREVYRLRWWNYAERQKSLYDGLKRLRRCLVTAQTSKYVTVSIQGTDLVFSQALIVLLLDDSLRLGALTSTLHSVWVMRYASSLETRLRYVPTDCLETFPFPRAETDSGIVDRYHTFRRELMIQKQEGLTKVYNRFHDPRETSADIIQLRDLHVRLDQAVSAGYGWRDLDLRHGFYETTQGLRFTISEIACRIVLDRLLSLNHQHYQEEVAAGLHDKKKGRNKSASSKVPAASNNQPGLLDVTR